jgi:glyoxylase-like metal-dependent hydrolase (beta-lactamase superfamily II)
MKCTIVPVTNYQQNCSVLFDEQTNKVAVVDPGGDMERIEAAIQQLGGQLAEVRCAH